MAAARAAWKGFLKIGSVSCGVKIIGAVTEAEKIHFRILNRKDGLPVKSAYVDEETGDIVEKFDAALALPRPRTLARWTGTYASAAGPMFMDRPADAVRLVMITGGTGASTSFAIAEETLSDLFD